MTFEDILTICGSTHMKFGKNKGYTDLIHFDLKRKRISNGKVILMDNGKIVPQTLKLGDLEFTLTEDMQLLRETESNPYPRLESLYKSYKYSVPEPYDSYARCNFRALNINDLTPKEVRDGEKRQLARIKLETFVMFTKFPWKNEKHHYWQSENDADLILFKEWRD